MAHHPIRVDNSEPATVGDVARILGVSRKRTAEIVRAVRRIVRRDSNTGDIVISNARPANTSARSRNGNRKTTKTASARRRISR